MMVFLEMGVRASIGTAVYPLEGEQADELIQQSQAALNAVQETGGYGQSERRLPLFIS